MRLQNVAELELWKACVVNILRSGKTDSIAVADADRIINKLRDRTTV